MEDILLGRRELCRWRWLMIETESKKKQGCPLFKTISNYRTLGTKKISEENFVGCGTFLCDEYWSVVGDVYKKVGVIALAGTVPHRMQTS
jgi:hypothetical protein